MFGNKSLRVNYIGKRRGEDNNVFCIEGNAFDAALYVDRVRQMYDGSFDYLVIEPVFDNFIKPDLF